MYSPPASAVEPVRDQHLAETWPPGEGVRQEKQRLPLANVVRSPAPRKPTSQVTTSVTVPWLFGLLALLSIAAAATVAGGRVSSGVAIPATVLDLQQDAAVAAAQQIRTTLESGLQDVEQLAESLGTAADLTAIDTEVKSFAKRYQRYRSVYVLDESAKVLSVSGPAPQVTRIARDATAAAITDAFDIDHKAVLSQYVPFAWAGGAKAILAADYDLARLRSALDRVKPSSAWVVNSKGQVIASTEGFVAFGQPPRSQLKEAAANSVKKPGIAVRQGDIDAGEIVAYAPVRADGKSGKVPKWGVMTARGVGTIVLPQTQARDQAMLLGLSLTVVTAGVFAWMYVVWLRPLRRLASDARRVSNGDLAEPVQIRRNDEIGQIARALERIRSDRSGQSAGEPWRPE